VVICGINLTHDGGVALVEQNRLVMSLECEKFGTGLRHGSVVDLTQVTAVLGERGIRLKDIDRFVLSGWLSRPGELASLTSKQSGRELQIPAAPYTDLGSSKGVLHRYELEAIPDGPLMRGYVSYSHVSNHVIGAYCSSPFAQRCEDAYVLAWDGGMSARLYWLTPHPLKIKYLGPLTLLSGDCFIDFCMQFEPFLIDTSVMTPEEAFRVRYEVPGKAMAYAALGSVNSSVFPLLDAIIDKHEDNGASDKPLGAILGLKARELFPDMTGGDLIATFQDYIGHTLVSNLQRLLRRKINADRARLCMSGGCALNIKWNSLIRRSGIFSEIWVPPFTNDSGAALGMACCEMMRSESGISLDWDVYSGPALIPSRVPQEWKARECNEEQLAQVLHEEGEPVVVLYGRAELGPRALGNRSILAPAVHPRMKERLNEIKKRASYRPVAPLCLESHAHEVFDPGCLDPFMLFEHRVRPNWINRIPAIVHLDGSARLQTINSAKDTAAAGRILKHYALLSGIPVLCNTSANLPGHGFFQNALAACEWGRTRYVWADGVLYTNPSEPVGAHLTGT
jgi:carbamoyltransferase